MKNFSMSKMDFRKKCQLRAVCSVFIALAGIAMFIFATQVSYPTHFTEGFYTGGGGGLMGAGVATFFMNFRYLHNSEKMKEAQRKENDERNIFITNKALSLTAFISMFVLYIAMLIAGTYSELIVAVLVSVFLGAVAIWLIVYIILNKIY